jgi:uncharacterized protein YybS (DUF2232 family)
LVLVETAFLSSAASLIFLVNAYFPIGPLFRIFFPIPISLVYLRWGNRAAWMSALISGLLLTVLMGPTRSILFVMPFGLLGVQLGWLWKRSASWSTAIGLGSILSTIGLFFRLWLLSVLAGEDLWLYSTTIVTGWIEGLFLRFGILHPPELWIVQLLTVILVIVNSVVYLFTVHLVAWWLLERLGSPIPEPPKWVRVLLEEE